MKKIKIIIFFILIVLAIMFSNPTYVNAEGSYDLIKDAPATSYRPIWIYCVFK